MVRRPAREELTGPIDREPPTIDRAVVLAGGGGTRLWPWTGPGTPKPLLPLGGDGRTLLRGTLERLQGLVPEGGVSIQCSPEVSRLLAESEPAIPLDVEPSPRDTGPAVALAMRRIRDVDPEAVVALLPADQRCDDDIAYRAALAQAGRLARDGALVVLAVPPARVETRFGYLECAALPGDDALAVTRFVEKPDAETAARWLAGGRHFWNAGIFVWRCDAFDAALSRHAPGMAEAVTRTADGDVAAWEDAPATSIDYALLERAGRLSAVRLEAGWDDVGSWEAVGRLADAGDSGPLERLEADGDAAAGSLVLAVRGCRPAGRPVLLGEEPLLVVFGPGGVLVSPRSVADGVRRYAR